LFRGWGDDAAKKGANSGVMNIEGIWKMNCSKCGINDTHTTKYHDEQLRNVATFRLPASHPWYITSGKPYQAAAVVGSVLALPGAGASVPGSAGSGSMLGSLTSLVDRTITSTENSEMSAFLSEFCNVLGN
jgi:hypothetical protein